MGMDPELANLTADEIRRLLHGQSVAPRGNSDTSNTSCGTRARLGWVPLMGSEVVLDDEGSAFVLVFPCEESLGGTVDIDAMIQEPMEAAERIFCRRRNAASMDTLNEGFDLLASGPVRAGVYQSVVRAAVVKILIATGMKLDTFPSVDGDESFLRLSLDADGDVVRRLAQRFRYRVPVKLSVYKDMPAEGADFEGGRPMVDHGKPLLAHVEYDEQLREHLQPFRHIDVVRLVHMCLDEWLDLNEMRKQNVLSAFFPAMHYEQMRRIHSEWGDWKHAWKLPSHNHEDQVRDYLGENSSFFFRWFAFYVRSLVPIAVIGGICALRRVEAFHVALDKQRYVQVGFALILCLWAALFQQMFNKKTQVAVRNWGMKDWASMHSVDRAEYKPKMEGTWRLWMQRSFSEFSVLVFCLLFVAVILWIENIYSEGLQNNDLWAHQYGGYITVGLIKVVSLSWGMIAPVIVNMQNHRTEFDHNNAMTRVLAMVKIFVALFPFVNQAFLKKFSEPTCGESFVDAALKVYGDIGWPDGIPHADPVLKLANGTVGLVDGDALLWLTQFSFINRREQQCIYGCFPVRCVGNAACVTNCMQRLEQDLWLVYITHVGCTVAFSLVIPIALAKISVVMELWKVQRRGEDKPYTLLQFQAKCSEIASYEYGSWGGSQVEDFLELAIGFAMLTCFGIALPAMAVLALLSHIIEYRLLAYRMTNVTCRPFPAGADGIGVWDKIFDAICDLAVIINIVKITISGESSQLKRIDDFNERVVALIHSRTSRYAAVTVPEDCRQRASSVNVSLGPKSCHFEVLNDLSLNFL
mmetsp:Transcript_78897/g.254863  ORF Transcript_78897/g.254863 Transcript_78897/m.254863 type:complete len:808 (+) Transcript_78897:86-2509(+)